ncbi:SLBB domain-containing protein [soil metagenome]
MYFHRLLLTLCGTFLLLLTLFSAAIAQNQNGDQDRAQPRAFQTIMGTDQIYFVDHIGLQLLDRQLPVSEYLQSEHFKLGPQDVLSVDVAGPVPITARGLPINSQGQVFIPLVGNVDVNNLSLDEAHNRIEEALARELNEFNLKVTIDRPRQVAVLVHGNIPYPGRYIVPAGTRLDAVVYAALIDGTVDPNQVSPNDMEQALLSTRNFSMRNIRITRSGSEYQLEGDLIPYFRIGDVESNPYVYSGDQIRIQRISQTSPTISISGAVHSSREMEYHRSDKIERLLDMAGGYLAEADRNRVVIHRTENRQTSKIELELTDENRNNFELLPNDRIVVPYQEDDARNYSAWIQGEAIMPGNYPIQGEETSVRDLLDTAGGLTPNALAESAYIVRGLVHTRNVRASTSFNVAELQRSSDQLAQGFEYLQMEEQLNTENRVHVNLRDETELNDTMIRHGDRLYIPKDHNAVILYGQVNNPGNYAFNQSMQIDDYLQKAGGMTIAADTERVFVIKAGSRAWKPPSETTIQSGDIIFVDRVPYDEFQAQRNYDIQVRNLRRSNLQLVLTTVSTITAVVTTYVAITR